MDVVDSTSEEAGKESDTASASRSGSLYPELTNDPRLRVADFLAAHLELLGRVVASYPFLVDMMLILEVRGHLRRTLVDFLSAEVALFKQRNQSTELLRESTPGAVLLSAFMTLDTFQPVRVLYSGNVAGLIMAKLRWTPAVMYSVIKEALDAMLASSKSAPAELCLLVQVLCDIERALDVPLLAVRVLFLRFVGPALTQPVDVCNLDVTDAVRLKMVAVAKCLQLVVNGTEPQEDAFSHGIKDKFPKLLISCQSLVERLDARPRSALTPTLISPSLRDPAAHLRNFVKETIADDAPLRAAWDAMADADDTTD